MRQLLKNVTIARKLQIASALSIVLVVGLITYFIAGIVRIDAEFQVFKDEASKAVFLANLSEDLAEARIAVLKFRLDPTEDFITEVSSNIDEILQARSEVDGIISDAGQIDRLIELENDVVEYSDIFAQATIVQEDIDASQDQLDRIGPVFRSHLSEIMDAAYADNDTETALYAAKVQQHFLLARLYAKKFTRNFNAEYAERAEQELDKAMAQTTGLLKSLSDPRQIELANLVVNGIKEYGSVFSSIQAYSQTITALYRDGLDTIGPRVLDGYGAEFELLQTTQAAISEEVAALEAEIQRTSVIAGVVIAALVGALLFAIGNLVSRSLGSIRDQMERLSKGERELTVQGAERGDEIGAMASALEVFRQNAIEVEKLEADRKAADQRNAEARRSEMSQLADQFEASVGRIALDVEQAAKEMQQMADVIDNGLSTTLTQCEAASSASSEASGNVQTVAAAAEEMSASIREITQSVASTAEATKSCAELAELSGDRLSSLQQAVSEIDGVIQSIKDVAEQTNLLALNATIEAARAGEAGRGFAVVAGEVKALANQTNQMTGEISQKVDEVKTSADLTISSVNDIFDQIRAVDGKTTTVAAAVEEQDASTGEVSRNIQEAAGFTSEVSRSVVEAQQRVTESASATKQLGAASESLTAGAAELKSAMQSFLDQVRAA